MRVVCAVDPGPLVGLLGCVSWQRSGTAPWDGTYGMVGWSHMPPAVRRAVMETALAVLRHLPGRVRGTTFLAKLVPGQVVPAHTDAEDDSCTQRVHVPLLTNEAAVFVQGRAVERLPVGWAYLFDPTAEHSAVNNGTTDRVHLFFNAVATGQGG